MVAKVLGPVVASLGLVVLLSGCAGAPGPGTEPMTAPARTERLELAKECLAERGWTVSIADGGIASGLIPDGQIEKYQAAVEECFSSLPPGAGFDDMPERERRDSYEFFVQTRECLVNGGVDLPPAPSYEAWTEGKGVWRPYNDIPDDQIFEVHAKFQDTCPEVPEWAR